MPAPRFDNLVQLYRWACDHHAERPLFGTKTGDGWTWINRRELLQQVDHLRGGLASLGVGDGARVAVVSNNRVEWAVACYATYGLGATFVPLYEAQRPEEWEFILGDCDAHTVIGSTDEVVEKLRTLSANLPALQHVVGMELPPDDPHSFAALMEVGRSHVPAPVEPHADHVAGFIYTSGTTGKPKGVVLSHGNIASNINAIMQTFPIEPEDRTLSFLPWAHSYGQVGELHYGMASGCGLALNDHIPNLMDNMAAVQPTVLVAVPRIFNRLYERVVTQISNEPALVRKMFWDGIEASSRKNHGNPVSWVRELEIKLDEKMIFSKVRAKLGGRLRLVFSASAALSREVAEFIDALGLRVYEGYGLSETSPAVTMNTPENRRIGSVGKPLPGVRVTIDEEATDEPGEGEVIIHGPNVMKGYHNRPEENEKVFTPDGGLRTGDLGYFDDDGFLFITGRIKEQYKLSNGRYVMPAPLEEKLTLSPYIANAMLYGDNRPHNVALVVPDAAAIERWAEERGRAAPEDPSRDPEVQQLLEREVQKHAADFRRYEIPKQIAVVSDDFTIDNGLLTPTLKLKRRKVVEAYQDVLEELYRRPTEETTIAAE
jgi:long-chain acyl-CoA synthetase